MITTPRMHAEVLSLNMAEFLLQLVYTHRSKAETENQFALALGASSHMYHTVDVCAIVGVILPVQATIHLPRCSCPGGRRPLNNSQTRRALTSNSYL